MDILVFFVTEWYRYSTCEDCAPRFSGVRYWHALAPLTAGPTMHQHAPLMPRTVDAHCESPLLPLVLVDGITTRSCLKQLNTCRSNAFPSCPCRLP